MASPPTAKAYTILYQLVHIVQAALRSRHFNIIITRHFENDLFLMVSQIESAGLNKCMLRIFLIRAHGGRFSGMQTNEMLKRE